MVTGDTTDATDDAVQENIIAVVSPNEFLHRAWVPRPCVRGWRWGAGLQEPLKRVSKHH